MRPTNGWLAIFLLIVITGCASPSAIPVVERKQPPSEKINHHWVAEGETLYAIAWRYNLDVEALARVNQIRAEHKIYVGQTLRLDTASVSEAGRNKVQPNQNKPIVRVDTNVDIVAAQRAKWRRPTQGKVIKSFSYSASKGVGHKGIDIQARIGQAVYASKDGVVVYAGSGLQAYGNLLIVKHAQNFLSAYAHNSRLSVAEGERVKAGEKIAEAGKTGTTYEHLHFEIRKQGVPVNPMRLLEL